MDEQTFEKYASFSDFDLKPELLNSILRKGFEKPMPVQSAVLAHDGIMDNDIIVQAKTGSGKTLAFALPLLNALSDEELKNAAIEKTPLILVLSPTRELAQQTAREFAWLGADLRIRVATLVGGLDMERQIRTLRDGAVVVVGTPGRVLDHIRRGTFKTAGIKSLVLDEGDSMLDMGFREELEAILESADEVDRTWLFSATMPPEVLDLSKQFLDAPQRISLVTDVTTHSDITQRAYIIPSRKRFEGLVNVLIWEAPAKSLLFCGTRAETQEIADKLCDIGFRAAAIHGDMSQRERNTALSALRGGRVSILVATDVAARGLDIDAVSHVIQYGLPQNLEAFVHRSGRTGRAGHEGSNLILLTAREARQFKFMLSHEGSKLKLQWVPAPDAAEIESQSRIRFENNIIEHALESNEFEAWAKELLNREEAAILVSGLLAKAYGSEPSGYTIREEVQQEMAREKERRERKYGSEERKEPKRGAEHYRLEAAGFAVTLGLGRNDGVQVGPLLGKLCRCLGIGREDVGNIRMRDNETVVELSQYGGEMASARGERLDREGISIENIRPIRARSERPSGREENTNHEHASRRIHAREHDYVPKRDGEGYARRRRDSRETREEEPRRARKRFIRQ